MLPNGAIMIGQPSSGGTNLPLHSQMINQNVVFIRNPTSALTSNFEMASQGLQTYALFQPNTSPYHQLQSQAVQVLPSSAFHHLSNPFQTNGVTLAYLPSHQPHPQQTTTKRRASDSPSPSTSSCRNAENKKPKLESNSRKILHFKGLPSDITKSEVTKLSSIYGGVTKVLMSGNEAFVEMTDLHSAQNVIAYYSQKSISLRNHLIQVQMSEDLVDFSSQDGSETSANNIVDSDNRFKSAVLIVSVENVIFPVTVDDIKKLFASFGQIAATATFTTNDSSHLLIEFMDISSAENAKTRLNGQFLCPGGNRLKIDYSAMTTLEQQQQQPPSPMNFQTFEQLVHPYVFDTSLQQPITIINPNNFITKPKELIPLSATSILDPKYLTQFNSPIMANSFSNNQVFMSNASLLSIGNVLLVSNLDESNVSPDALFTLFGVYGDVIRVKIMFNKKDTALIQFNDPLQAQTAFLNLDKLKLWGKVIKIASSKHTSVQMPREGQPGAGLTKDYKHSPLHRFKKPNSKNYSNIFPPSSTLHLSNIPSTSKERLSEMFGEYGTIVGFKFFNNVVSANRDCKMALMQMSSVEEAAHALIGLHNYQLAETTHLRVSFSKSSVVPHPSSADNQESTEQIETESATPNSDTSSIETSHN